MKIYKVDWGITSIDKNNNNNILNKDVKIWITKETYKEILENFNYTKEDCPILEEQDKKNLSKSETLKDLFWFIHN